MKSKLFFSALFDLRNLSLLAIFGATAYIAGNVRPDIVTYTYPAAGALYLGFVIQSLFSKSFNEKFNRRQKIKEIRELNRQSINLAYEAKRHVNPALLKRLHKVMDDKKDIVQCFFRGEYDYLKQKIVEQALKLVIAYEKLLINYCIRSRELSEMNIAEITNRINLNIRKLNFAQEPSAIESIKKVIEIDEKFLTRIKEEKSELETINSKLEFMEGTVNMFKHQIISNIETEDMVETLETAVNEASALYSVLEDRRKNKIKL